MKRVICALLCMILALSLAACGQKTEAPAAAAPAPTAAPAAPADKLLCIHGSQTGLLPCSNSVAPLSEHKHHS